MVHTFSIYKNRKSYSIYPSEGNAFPGHAEILQALAAEGHERALAVMQRTYATRAKYRLARREVVRTPEGNAMREKLQVPYPNEEYIVTTGQVDGRIPQWRIACAVARALCDGRRIAEVQHSKNKHLPAHKQLIMPVEFTIEKKQ